MHKVSKAFAITVKTANQEVKLVQNSDADLEIGVVRTGKKRVALPANQVTTVYIRAHVNARARGQHMFFSHDMHNPQPEGLICSDVLVQIPEKRVLYVPIFMTNTTGTIHLDRHKVIGLLEPIKTVYSTSIRLQKNKSETTEIK